MSFLNFQALWHLVWIIPFLILLYWWARARRIKFLSAVLGGRSDDPDFVLVSKGRRFFRFVLLLFAVFFLMLAAARPYWGMKIMPFTGKGRDLLFVLDVSKSMLSKDIQPSRLDHAKWFVRQLVSDTYGDRYGLIGFAGAAYLDCPLTSDRTSFFQVLDELEPGSAARGGTNIQKALEEALKAFNAAESGHRAIVLISDGDELTGKSSQEISSLNAKKIPLFVVGVGDPTKPGLISITSPDGKTTFMRDRKGELVKSRLNEPQLRKLALDTGGIYVRSTATNTGLDQILQRVKNLVPKGFDSGKHTKPIERFHFPLVISVLLFLIWLAISERKINGVKMKKAALVAIGGFIFALFGFQNQLSAQLVNNRGQVGPLRMPSGKGGSMPGVPMQLPVQPQQGGVQKEAKEEPPPKFDKKEVNDAVAVYNKALELQKKNSKYSPKLYEQAINLSQNKPEVRAKSYQNLGVMLHNKARMELFKSNGMVKQQNLDGALKNIDAALKEMDKTEEMYVQAMRASRLAAENKDESKSEDEKTDGKKLSADDISKNQQKLLNDRALAKKLKKLIEELKKKQKEAQKKTQQAKQKQNKANQDKKQQKQKQKKQQKKKDQKKQQKQKQQQQNKQQNKQQNQQQKQKQQKKQDQNQQKQNQKKQQQQKQKQKQQQNQQKENQNQIKKNNQNQQKQKQTPQQKANQARKEAQKAVDDFKKQAQDLKQKKMEKQAEEAQKELKKAEEAQKKKQGKKAEEHLKKALEHLSPPNKNKQQNKQNKNNQKKNQKNKDQQKKNQKNKQDKNKKGDKDKKLPEPKQMKAKPAKPEKEKEIDPKQAEALLEVMANDEKTLRDAIKENQRKQYKLMDVEKDW